jgi:hypothetical protein
MNADKAIMLIIVGGIFLVLGITINQFYAAKGILGVSLSDKPIATWKGRLIFLTVGSVFCALGIAYFFSDH